MRKLIWLIPLLLIVSPLYGQFGRNSGSSGSGAAMSAQAIAESLATVDTVKVERLIANDGIVTDESNTTVDTSLYIKKYGARTDYYGLVMDIDTSANTAGNVIGIDMSGSNAIDGTSDYWIYLNNRDYWRPSKTGGICLEGDITKYGANDFSFVHLYSYNFLFRWQNEDKGDFIIRDGTNTASTVNNDFFQIQDSAGTMQFAFANKYIRGTATFDAAKTADTLVMTGVTATDYYFLQWKGATVPTSPLTYTAAVNSLIVNCSVADTSVARASGYNWLRMQ